MFEKELIELLKKNESLLKDYERFLKEEESKKEGLA